MKIPSKLKLKENDKVELQKDIENILKQHKSNLKKAKNLKLDKAFENLKINKIKINTKGEKPSIKIEYSCTSTAAKDTEITGQTHITSQKRGIKALNELASFIQKKEEESPPPSVESPTTKKETKGSPPSRARASAFSKPLELLRETRKSTPQEKITKRHTLQPLKESPISSAIRPTSLSVTRKRADTLKNRAISTTSPPHSEGKTSRKSTAIEIVLASRTSRRSSTQPPSNEQIKANKTLRRSLANARRSLGYNDNTPSLQLSKKDAENLNSEIEKLSRKSIQGDPEATEELDALFELIVEEKAENYIRPFEQFNDASSSLRQEAEQKLGYLKAQIEGLETIRTPSFVGKRTEILENIETAKFLLKTLQHTIKEVDFSESEEGLPSLDEEDDFTTFFSNKLVSINEYIETVLKIKENLDILKETLGKKEAMPPNRFFVAINPDHFSPILNLANQHEFTEQANQLSGALANAQEKFSFTPAESLKTPSPEEQGRPLSAERSTSSPPKRTSMDTTWTASKKPEGKRNSKKEKLIGKRKSKQPKKEELVIPSSPVESEKAQTTEPIKAEDITQDFLKDLKDLEDFVSQEEASQQNSSSTTVTNPQQEEVSEQKIDTPPPVPERDDPNAPRKSTKPSPFPIQTEVNKAQTTPKIEEKKDLSIITSSFYEEGSLILNSLKEVNDPILKSQIDVLINKYNECFNEVNNAETSSEKITKFYESLSSPKFKEFLSQQKTILSSPLLSSFTSPHFKHATTIHNLLKNIEKTADEIEKQLTFPENQSLVNKQAIITKTQIESLAELFSKSIEIEAVLSKYKNNILNTIIDLESISSIISLLPQKGKNTIPQQLKDEFAQLKIIHQKLILENITSLEECFSSFSKEPLENIEEKMKKVMAAYSSEEMNLFIKNATDLGVIGQSMTSLLEELNSYVDQNSIDQATNTFFESIEKDIMPISQFPQEIAYSPTFGLFMAPNNKLGTPFSKTIFEGSHPRGKPLSFSAETPPIFPVQTPPRFELFSKEITKLQARWEGKPPTSLYSKEQSKLKETLTSFNQQIGSRHPLTNNQQIIKKELDKVIADLEKSIEKTKDKDKKRELKKIQSELTDLIKKNQKIEKSIYSKIPKYIDLDNEKHVKIIMMAFLHPQVVNNSLQLSQVIQKLNKLDPSFSVSIEEIKKLMPSTQILSNFIKGLPPEKKQLAYHYQTLINQTYGAKTFTSITLSEKEKKAIESSLKEKSENATVDTHELQLETKKALTEKMQNLVSLSEEEKQAISTIQSKTKEKLENNPTEEEKYEIQIKEQVGIQEILNTKLFEPLKQERLETASNSLAFRWELLDNSTANIPSSNLPEDLSETLQSLKSQIGEAKRDCPHNMKLDTPPTTEQLNNLISSYKNAKHASASKKLAITINSVKQAITNHNLDQDPNYSELILTLKELEASDPYTQLNLLLPNLPNTQKEEALVAINVWKTAYKPKDGTKKLDTLFSDIASGKLEFNSNEYIQSYQSLADDLFELQAHFFSSINKDQLIQEKDNALFMKKVWEGKQKNKNSPDSVLLVNSFNDLSGFIISTISSYMNPNQPTQDKTKRVIKFFDYLRVDCYEKGNLFAAAAIDAAFESSVLFSSKQMKHYIATHKKDRPAKVPTNHLWETELNYKSYKNEVNSRNLTSSKYIPYIGTTLTDITFSLDGNKNLPGYRSELADTTTIEIEQVQSKVLPSLESLSFDLSTIQGKAMSNSLESALYKGITKKTKK